MAKGHYLGEFEHLVMLAVARGPGDGVAGADVHELLERVVRRDASLPAIYVTLARLERKGFLRSRPVDPDGGRPRRMFTVTRTGAAALQRSRDALERLWARPRTTDGG